MRINIYSDDITNRIEVIEKTADTGTWFLGLRVYVKSPPELHHTASAVTFWFDDGGAFTRFCTAIIEAEGDYYLDNQTDTDLQDCKIVPLPRNLRDDRL